MTAPLEDIVVRLRKRAEIRRRIRSEGDRIARDMEEAAAEIERLREIATRWCDAAPGDDGPYVDMCVALGRP